MTNPCLKTELIVSCFPWELASETKGGMAKENPNANTKMEKNNAFPKETEAKACAPKSFPTMMLSKRFTDTCPTCVSITGSASFSPCCVYCLSKNFIF